MRDEGLEKGLRVPDLIPEECWTFCNGEMDCVYKNLREMSLEYVVYCVDGFLLFGMF